jgi:hypothetical protein
MVVEVLYFDGCLSHERLLPTVRRLAEQAGAELRQRRIETPREAELEHFLGYSQDTPEAANSARVTPLAANCGLRMIGCGRGR